MATSTVTVSSTKVGELRANMNSSSRNFISRVPGALMRSRCGMQARSLALSARANADSDPFDTDMAKAMEKQYGFGQGKRVHWGVLTRDADQDELNDQSPETQQRRATLRELAATEMVNIDNDERARRKVIAGFAGLVALVVATGLTVGEVNNPLIRGGAMYLPLAISIGFYGSGQQGL
mmetsp:Transcript_9463/g.17774  ORF Transcript_9463/g.17774 Transcript_9463/m.17774 type:complete len:179 (-) Transcript_9463:831-1367(-)|eukprot:CAMPEP_0114287228 /NCGR_PEP_ID=MMETSP0059-20121206/6168_1 /TAXON_ID=36894 /ORGANISM="Pyramimonas parkeae, Strain CCMP726" /LENGTH=178 /DNA_ID=CAMNT_0001408299 /DNA_START=144 /DNA_END=680 /DNA_ORIENTATION=+